MKVLYKKEIWEVLCPKDLKFSPYIIRNVLIEREGKRIITNIKEIKKTKEFGAMDKFLKRE